MALDVYQPCPCGSGKKIKFCCCADIQHDLERVLRIMEGEQRLAALDAIDKALAKHPHRAALLSLRAELQMELEQYAEAEKTVDECLAHAPGAGTALGAKAILRAALGSGREAISPLQQALALADESISSTVYNALGVVAQRLLMDGEMVSARAHYMLQASMGGENDSTPFVQFLKLNTSPQFPLLFKTEAQLATCDSQAPWKSEFDAASTLGERGNWQQALAKFQVLAARAPGDAAILKNIAQLAGYLCESSLAADALRRYAAIESLPLDDRVEAEATAQIYMQTEEQLNVDVANCVQNLDDADAVQEILLSDKRFQAMPVPEWGPELGPPPKSAFLLLDVPVPPGHAGISLAEVPRVLTNVLLFGRQTDRPPQLCWELPHNENAAPIRARLAEVLGAHAQGELQETVVGPVPIDIIFRSQIRPPSDTPEETIIQWRQELSRETYLNRWPKLARGELGGKTPLEAARDPAHPVKVLASVLNLELHNATGLSFDFNELRRKLGLPTCDPIDASKLDPMRIPPARLARIRMDRLNDEALVVVLRRAGMYQITQALARGLEELSHRSNLASQVPVPHYYSMLASQQLASAEALKYLKRAQDEALARRESPAEFLLQEVTVRIRRQEATEINRLLGILQTRHISEPGIAEALLSLMMRLGLVSPEQLREMGVRPGAAGRAQAVPVPAAAAAPAGGLWTPEGGAPAPAEAAPAERSKLWLPGTE